MVIGPFINAGAVLLGGVLGAVLSQRLPERIRVSMPSIFGLASLGIGILLVVKCANLLCMLAGCRLLKGRFKALAAVGCVLCLMLLAMVGWKSVYAIVMLAGLWVFLPKRQDPQAR